MSVPGANNDVTMYLSPDERFLTSTLYDMSADPEKEVARIATNVTALLMRDESPRLPGTSTRITLVEFVDFQCPYCKQLAEWYAHLPESLQGQTTVIFKNLPLPQHPWARSAASYATCASQQSLPGFRQVMEFFFHQQSDLTPDGLKEKLFTALRPSSSLDLQKLDECASSAEISSVIERDTEVARQLNVNSTPTLFINGRRVVHVTSAADLKRLLENELAESSIDARGK